MDEGKRARGESDDRQTGWDESDETRGVVKRRLHEIEHMRFHANLIRDQNKPDTMNRNTTIVH